MGSSDIQASAGRRPRLERAGSVAVHAVTVALPFAVFFWMAPFVGDRTIGNDYVMYPTPHQQELQYSVAHGTWPLHAPGFAGGRPSAALTLGQLFHPISHLCARLPGYWDGMALELNTAFRLLSLGLAQLALLVMLRRFGLRLDLAFVASFVAVYNMRVLDIFRFGASLENFTGHVFLCAAVAFHLWRPTRVLGPALMIGATYLLAVGGHPQMMYFGLLGSAVFTLALPFVMPPGGEEAIRARSLPRFYGAVGASVASGLLLAAAYLVPLYFDFVAETSARVSQDYRWSLLNCDSWGGALNSFFQPLTASVTGAFGGSALILAVPLAILAAPLRARIPKGPVALVALLVAVFLISLGEATPIHRLFWEHFPLARSFRVPGRITMLFPMGFLLVMAWLFVRGHERGTFLGRAIPIPAQTLVLGAALASYLGYDLWLADGVPPAGFPLPCRFRDIPGWVEPASFWLGAAALAAGAAHGLRWRGRGVIGFLLAAVVVGQTLVVLQHGTWIVQKKPTTTMAAMDAQKRGSLDYRGAPGNRLQSDLVDRKMRDSFLERDLARFYRRWVAVSDLDEAYRAMRRSRDAHSAVVEGFEGAGRMPPPEVPVPEPDEIRLEEATFNRLVFSVRNNRDGFFDLAFMDAHRWSARVDGAAVAVHRANGGEQAVFLRRGDHRVEMEFSSPASVAGMAVSLLALMGIGVFFCARALGGRARIAAIAACAAIPAAIFVLWHGALYGGDPLGTEYAWSSDRLPDPANLAYGRPARMSSIHTDQTPYPFYAGRAVDGDTRSSGFTTKRGKKGAWWQVDLGSSRAIGRVVIHDGAGRRAKNHLPMKVTVSDDGKRFRTAATLEDRGEEVPWHIDLGGRKARFVRLSSRKPSPMSFAEVEIFPPEDVPGGEQVGE